MKAEFFCLTGDVPRAELLKKLISTHIDPSITLTVYDIEKGYERWQLASRYEQLIQASIPPALGLSLLVTTLDWFQIVCMFGSTGRSLLKGTGRRQKVPQYTTKVMR